MSRIGKKEILIPKNVIIKKEDNNIITVIGKKGKLKKKFSNKINIKILNNIIKISLLNNNDKKNNAIFGTSRALLNNMIIGVNIGFEKKLKLVGVGYKAVFENNNIILNVGFSKPIKILICNRINIEIIKNVLIFIKGIDKILVGETAAKIRRVKIPDSYKGKGIRYFDEKIILKVGKTGK